VSALDLTLRGQAEAIASGEADAAELLDASLARIEERNPAVNAVVATFPERSREMLDAAPRGPLHGVPVVLKDEWPLPWRAQRFGMAEMLTPAAPAESGPYRALRDAGAVIVGVGNMHEAGASSTGNVSVYGPARNPWDTERCPGGSSSGPGAAVGARLVAGAVGADGIGSIRFPAAYCGLTGLKPTFGRSAMEGHHMAEVTTTIVSGPLCADAADCRLLGSALFGERLAAGADLAGLRIGVVDDVVSENVAPEVREACETAIEQLREATGGEVRTVALADLEASALATVIIANAEGLGGVTPQRLNELNPELTPINRGFAKYRMLLPAAVAAKSARVRTAMRRRLAAVFEDVDVLAWPTVPAVAPPLEAPLVELPSGTVTADEANVRGAGLANLTGTPAISVPVGLSGDGMPLALQLQAAWGRDELLLDAAEALEGANGRRWVESLPPLAAEPTEA
jgi:Asp-tRNA(Asn)/Glu-tRNA(Gln) amidotransferase A subunit family amidase